MFSPQVTLKYCTNYESSTCCSSSYTIYVGQQASMFEAQTRGILTEECIDRLQISMCTRCHPLIGTAQISSFPSKGYCDSVWNACKGAKYSFFGNVLIPDAKGDVQYGTPSEFFRGATFQFHMVMYQLSLCGIYYELG